MPESGARRWARRGAALLVLLSRGAGAQPLESAAAPRFDSRVRGVIGGVGIGTSSVGDYLLVALGGQWQGIQSLRAGRWLLQWDVLLAARGGYLANQEPYLFLLGARLASFLELGYRWQAEQPLSPYLGLRAAADQQVLGHFGRSFSDFDQFNSVDGVGGLVARGALRLALGASLLEQERSLLLVGFLEEAFQDLQVNTEALALTQLGLAARFDLRSGLSAGLEGAWGFARERQDSQRALRDQRQRVSLRGGLRWVFEHTGWIEARASLARDSNQLEYSGGRSYATRDAPVFDVEVVYGFALERFLQ